MSQRNGDRARFERNRKKKILRRTRNRRLLKAAASVRPLARTMEHPELSL
jgi:hypothetical protein